eukprot:8936584-Pyramimonas_sp.AAC.1
MITNLHLKFVRAVNIASGRALDDDNSGKLRAFPPTERGDINLVGLYKHCRCVGVASAPRWVQ